ncbi:MAG: hypothetical protein Q8R72_02440 [Hylemonella sp.]|nr:hypothetical protein [Hylemonella sp.]
MSRSEALKIKALLKMPAKKAKSKAYINQSLAVAIGFVATVPPGGMLWRTAARLLCISESALSLFGAVGAE